MMKGYEATKQALKNKQERTAAFQRPFKAAKNETQTKYYKVSCTSKKEKSTERKLGGKARLDQIESERSNIALSRALWHPTQNKSCSANRRGRTKPCK